MKLKIAVVQFYIKYYNPEFNLKRIERFIKKASGKADIIVFPEDFITGPVEFDLRLADSQKQYRKIMQKLAAQYKIDVVAGTIVEKEEENLYNVCYYIDSRGKIRGKHKKINLWPTERNIFTPGESVTVFKTQYGKIALSICWDIVSSRIFSLIQKKEPQIIFNVSNWHLTDAGPGFKYDKNSEVKLVDSFSVARAIETQSIVVFCTSADANQLWSKKYPCVGRSQIAMPFKGAVVRLGHNREHMFIHEVDTALLKVAEKAYLLKKYPVCAY